MKLKFIANVNVEKPVVDFLRKREFDTKWVADIDKQMSDIRVCEIANNEQRIVLTNDKDFGEIVFLQGKISYGVILLRIKGQDCFEKITLLEKFLDKYSDKIINHFVVITREKFRFLPMEVIK
jgi:predicted nuclease of predicted toxin-antitoxin system